ncbi:hypothetical protein ACOMHN_004797 [Nucella lapillus]
MRDLSGMFSLTSFIILLGFNVGGNALKIRTALAFSIASVIRRPCPTCRLTCIAVRSVAPWLFQPMFSPSIAKTCWLDTAGPLLKA